MNVEQITLEFISPSKLNELTNGENVTKTVWSYAGAENSTLILDTKNWTILCEANNVCESIANWLVNESSSVMKIETAEDTTEGFKKLDYTFAVSMIGQLCDAKNLIMYLQSLQQVFNVGMKQNNSSLNLSQKNNNEQLNK
jgi:hypothetical protein